MIALYISARRIAFIPSRIVRAVNDNVAAGPLLTAADGASVALNAPCIGVVTLAGGSSFHADEVAQ